MPKKYSFIYIKVFGFEILPRWLKKEFWKQLCAKVCVHCHSGSSGGLEERTKLREKVTLKLTSPTLPIMPTAVTIKLIKLGSCNFT